MEKNLRILLLFTLALPLLFSLISSSTPSLAAGPNQRTIFRGSGIGADALWSVTVGQFSNIELIAVKTSAGNDIIFIADAPGCAPFSCFGELLTTANVFQINPGLNSATLSPVTLEVCVGFDEFLNCIQEAPVTVQAKWTAVGPPLTANFLERFGHSIFHQVQGQRQATATGSLDGQQLGQSQAAFLIKFRSLQIF
jgi:hypothetical protein